jgi:2'-5' RNA ligase
VERVEHIVVPLDPVHARAVADLARRLATAVGCAPAAAPAHPHVTLASYRGVPPATAVAALEPVVAALAPFTVRAHGYGMFTGDHPEDLSLHVMVVRTAALDDLHGRVHRALYGVGAQTGGLTEARVWTPHITLIERHLTPARLGRAVELLAAREHRSWSIPVAAVAAGPRTGRRPAPLVLGGWPVSGP